VREEKKLSVKQPHEAYRLCCIGVPGEGKSVYRHLFLSPIRRVTLWNPMEDYDIGSRVTVDEYRDRIDDMRRGLLRMTVYPTGYDYETRREEYNALCAYVYEVGAQHFCTEEIALVAKPNDVPANLDLLYIKGRHRGVSLSAFGQRFHQFPLIVRGTSTELVAFKQIDPDDVKDFEDRIYPCESPTSLNLLPPHHYINWTSEEGAVLCTPLPFHKKEKVEFTTKENSLILFERWVQ
jgi:hypothetical protein